MPNFTYRIHDAIAGWLGGDAFLPPPTGVVCGLLTGAPSPDGTAVTEPDDVGYTRQPVTFNADSDEGVTTLSNAAPLVFGDAIMDWTAVNYLGLFDTDGNLLLYGRLRTQRICAAGKSLTFATGAITIGLR